jgi:hypothetical protein
MNKLYPFLGFSLLSLFKKNILSFSDKRILHFSQFSSCVVGFKYNIYNFNSKELKFKNNYNRIVLNNLYGRIRSPIKISRNYDRKKLYHNMIVTLGRNKCYLNIFTIYSYIKDNNNFISLLNQYIYSIEIFFHEERNIINTKEFNNLNTMDEYIKEIFNLYIIHKINHKILIDINDSAYNYNLIKIYFYFLCSCIEVGYNIKNNIESFESYKNFIIRNLIKLLIKGVFDETNIEYKLLNKYDFELVQSLIKTKFLNFRNSRTSGSSIKLNNSLNYQKRSFHTSFRPDENNLDENNLVAIVDNFRDLEWGENPVDIIKLDDSIFDELSDDISILNWYLENKWSTDYNLSYSILEYYYYYLYISYIESDINEIDLITNQLKDTIRYKRLLWLNDFPINMKNWIRYWEVIVNQEDLESSVYGLLGLNNQNSLSLENNSNITNINIDNSNIINTNSSNASINTSSTRIKTNRTYSFNSDPYTESLELEDNLEPSSRLYLTEQKLIFCSLTFTRIKDLIKILIKILNNIKINVINLLYKNKNNVDFLNIKGKKTKLLNSPFNSLGQKRLYHNLNSNTSNENTKNIITLLENSDKKVYLDYYALKDLNNININESYLANINKINKNVESLSKRYSKATYIGFDLTELFYINRIFILSKIVLEKNQKIFLDNNNNINSKKINSFSINKYIKFIKLLLIKLLTNKFILLSLFAFISRTLVKYFTGIDLLKYLGNTIHNDGPSIDGPLNSNLDSNSTLDVNNTSENILTSKFSDYDSTLEIENRESRLSFKKRMVKLFGVSILLYYKFKDCLWNLVYKKHNYDGQTNFIDYTNSRESNLLRSEGPNPYKYYENVDFIDWRRQPVVADNTDFYELVKLSKNTDENPLENSSDNLDSKWYNFEREDNLLPLASVQEFEQGSSSYNLLGHINKEYGIRDINNIYNPKNKWYNFKKDDEDMLPIQDFEQESYLDYLRKEYNIRDFKERIITNSNYNKNRIKSIKSRFIKYPAKDFDESFFEF